MSSGAFRNETDKQERRIDRERSRSLNAFSLPFEALGEVKTDLAVLATIASQLVAMDEIVYFLKYGDTNKYEETSTIEAVHRALDIYREVLSAMEERPAEDEYPFPQKETSLV